MMKQICYNICMWYYYDYDISKYNILTFVKVDTYCITGFMPCCTTNDNDESYNNNSSQLNVLINN